MVLAPVVNYVSTPVGLKDMTGRERRFALPWYQGLCRQEYLSLIKYRAKLSIINQIIPLS